MILDLQLESTRGRGRNCRFQEEMGDICVLVDVIILLYYKITNRIGRQLVEVLNCLRE